MSKFVIVVDSGIPYDISVANDAQLRRELKKLKRIADDGDYPYFDVTVYDELDKDVTDDVFARMNI